MVSSSDSYYNNNSKIKISLIIAFLLSSVTSIITLINGSSSGYSLSIYTEFPIYFWVFSLSAIGIGIAVVIKNLDNNWWKLGILLILLTNFTLLLLPFLKGYAFSGNGDQLSHLGYVKDIIFTGQINSLDIYPITHILISEFSYLSGVSVNVLINFVGPFFYVLFVLFTYLVSSQILNKNAAILSTLISTILVVYYYVQVFPMGFAFIMFPFVFYLYFRYMNEKSVSLAIALILVVFLMAFFHPVAAAVLILAFLTMEIGKLIFDKFKIKNINKQKKDLIIPLLLFIILISWIWNNAYVWADSVHNIVSWFSLELLSTPLTSTASEGFDKLGLNSFDIILLFIKKYGIIFAYLILSLIVSLKLILKNNFSFIKDKRNFFIFWCFLVLATVLWIVDYIVPLTQLSSGRLVCLVLAIFPIPVGLALYRFLTFEDTNNRFKICTRKNKELILCLIVFSLSIIGIFSIYQSPLVYVPNDAMDNMEITGGDWFLQNENPKLNIMNLEVASTYRYADAIEGYSLSHPQKYLTPPDHFGYENNTNLGQSLDKTAYLLSRNQVTLSLYDDGGLYSKIGRFNEGDFIKLDKDPTVNELYENGEMNIYIIKK